LKEGLNYSKFIVELIKYLWVFFNASTALIYSIALINKILRPTFKNLSTNQLIIVGIILLASIILNVFWVNKKRKSHSN